MEEIEKDDLQIYELGYHILPSVSEEDLPREVSKVQGAISNNRGSIISESFPEMRGLAYDISKRVETKHTTFSRSYFGWIKFEVERNSVRKIEQEVKTNPNILRFLLVKTVRENTLYVPRMTSTRREEPALNVPLVSEMSDKEIKAPISAEEIDKSIDELVIN